QLQDPLVGLRGLGPLGGRGLRDRLLGVLAAKARLAGGADRLGRGGGGLDLGEGHGAIGPFGRWATRWAARVHAGRTRTAAGRSRAGTCSTVRRTRQTPASAGSARPDVRRAGPGS